MLRRQLHCGNLNCFEQSHEQVACSSCRAPSRILNLQLRNRRLWGQLGAKQANKGDGSIGATKTSAPDAGSRVDATSSFSSLISLRVYINEGVTLARQ
jgi:hypothetical protein